MTFDQSWNNTRALLELLSFAANVGILIVAWKALEQLRIAKHDISTRVEREAAESSAAQLEFWAQKVIPLGRQLKEAFKEAGLPLQAGTMERFDRAEMKSAPKSVQDYAAAMDKFLRTQAEARAMVVELCNLIEASAMCFMTGVANEEIAFRSLSEPYCQIIEELRPVYCVHRTGQPISPFDYTVRLYRVWSQRRKKSELETQHDVLNEALKKAQREGVPVPPLGTRRG
jgi:hypothetical protein